MPFKTQYVRVTVRMPGHCVWTHLFLAQAVGGGGGDGSGGGSGGARGPRRDGSDTSNVRRSLMMARIQKLAEQISKLYRYIHIFICGTARAPRRVRAHRLEDTIGRGCPRRRRCQAGTTCR
eukprot:SAG22_NODE_4581_length_1226_cov_1.081633_3_plen_120_part_01